MFGYVSVPRGDTAKVAHLYYGNPTRNYPIFESDSEHTNIRIFAVEFPNYRNRCVFTDAIFVVL